MGAFIFYFAGFFVKKCADLCIKKENMKFLKEKPSKTQI